MGNGQNVLPEKINLSLRISADTPKPIDLRAETTVERGQSQKSHGGQLLNREWNNSQAAQQRHLLGKSVNVAANLSLRESNYQSKHSESKQNLLRHSWESLINAARNHRDFQFVGKSADKLWQQVKQSSEFKSSDVYINGKLETRVSSPFGELLVRLERSGSKIDAFLAALPPGERDVFRARYQLLQTFGAHELFAGKGVDLNKNGDFPVRVFLAQQGASRDLPISTIINLLRGGAPPDAQLMGKPDLSNGAGVMLLENAVMINGGQFLFNTASAATLSLSLSLYQNIEAFLPLADAAPEVLPPTDLSAETLLALPHLSAQNVAETFGTATQIEPDAETLMIAALLSGALLTVEKNQKEELRPVNLWTDADAGSRAAFSAGATGALMSATIGLTAANTEKSVGEVLGFAAGIVVGLRADGLRTFGANSLICLCQNDLNGFLSGGAPTALNAAPDIGFADDWQHDFDSRRTQVLLAF